MSQEIESARPTDPVLPQLERNIPMLRARVWKIVFRTPDARLWSGGLIRVAAASMDAAIDLAIRYLRQTYPEPCAQVDRSCVEGVEKLPGPVILESVTEDTYV